MSAVDAGDDTIDRWVIHHYRFDPARHQRRNVIVAAFDNQEEFDLELRARASNLRIEQAAGRRSDREQISGVALPAGYQATAAFGRAIRNAVRHGAAGAVAELQSKAPSESVDWLLRADKA